MSSSLNWACSLNQNHPTQMYEEYAACIALRLTNYHDTMTVCIVQSVWIIASEALVLLSTWWSTYGTMKIARTANHDVPLMYLLLRDGELLFLHLI